MELWSNFYFCEDLRRGFGPLEQDNCFNLCDLNMETTFNYDSFNVFLYLIWTFCYGMLCYVNMLYKTYRLYVFCDIKDDAPVTQ